MAISVHLDIVSPEAKIFSGLAEMLIITGAMGELGILPGHAPLLTNIKPGPIRVIRQGGAQDIYYISGGILEVQPNLITILADTITRATDIDEAEATKAKERAANSLTKKKAEADFSSVLSQLSQASAQLRTIQLARKNKKTL
jgi:F-type H+-transporting ATPase subunit epsilon